ncbi:MAG: flagellar export chaperone FliS [Phycisphaerales bacterium]|nr:flagellar export chaperone FliS [Phycisphaerales bacterium]
MAAPSQEYLKTKVMTASPEMLTLMLWDGAIRFAEQGKDAVLKKDIEGSYKALVRSQRIIMELNSSLKHSVNPDLCSKLASLYNFIHRRLVDANLKKDPHLIDDALEIMRHQRETWAMLIDQLTKERAAEAQGTMTANVGAVASAASTVHKSPSPTPRHAYPPFAVRPVAAPASLSVQG